MNCHGLLIVDKPTGVTSHNVVSWARRVFSTRGVGHAGTLDPLATGVLVLGIGQGTKLMPYVTQERKSYRVEIQLGVETDSLDTDGHVLRHEAVPEGLDRTRIEKALKNFLGKISQLPPLYSAVKIDGRRLYEYARKGQNVKIVAREVELFSASLVNFHNAIVTLDLECGSGFYVRSLARDLAVQLNTVGCVRALRRTESCGFDVSGAVSGSDLQHAARGDLERTAQFKGALISLADATKFLPQFTIEGDVLEDVRHGRKVLWERVSDAYLEGSQAMALLDSCRNLVAIARTEDNVMRVQRGFNTEH